MRKIILLLVLVFGINSYAQNIAVRENKKDKSFDLKITLPKDYKLSFSKNGKVQRVVEYEGVKYFNVKVIDDKKYIVKYHDDKELRTLHLFWFDAQRDLKAENESDFIINLLDDFQDRDIDDLQDDRDNERQ